jgi:hypothetical protein
MPPLVRAGLAAALLAALAVMTDRPPKSIRVGVAAGSAARAGASAARLSALCPRGTLPDGEVCVPVPAREIARRGADQPSPGGRVRAEHDRIERRPDRPEDFSKYRLPTDLPKGGSVSGTLVPAARGAAVRLVRLEHQEGEAEVLHAGELAGVPGRTVVTKHAVRDTGGLREYLAIFGNLARIEPAVTRGMAPKDGQTLGTVGDAATPGSPALDYEIRRLRSGVVVRSLEPADFVADARTVGCDARNVLPLK